MRKITTLSMIAFLMLVMSCKKDKKDGIENAGSGFRATVESHEGTGKTHLEGLAVKWDSGDAILVKSSTCTTPRGFTTTGSGATVNFDANETLPTNFYAPPYTGYYPASAFSGDQLTLPATQNYVENTFASGANPMTATSSETLLPFKNVCGVLKLQLYSATACQVQSISITSNNDEQLCGTGTVGFDTDNNPTLGTLSNGGSTLTLLMGEGGKAMSTSESAPTAYYFVVPTGTLGTSFTVKVTDTNGNVWSKTATATQNTIARSQITVLPEQAVATHTPVVPSTVTLTAGCEGTVYNVGGSVTVPDGEHTCEFGLVYSATNAAPTLDNGTKVVAGTATFSGTQSFTVDITGLTVGTTYHVRAYAMIDGAAYSAAKDIVGSTPLPMTWANGRSPKKFTVADPTPENPNSGDETKVYFSQGNLQYMGSTGTWKFADHQFDLIGYGQDGSDASNIDRDLFGWGTSGYNHGATCYQPWSTSQTNSDYYAYSTSTYTYNLFDETGMADWGKANAISNGGNQAGKWRTLTGGSSGEWNYLISSRSDAANLYGEGKVGNCTPGLIILPDDWSWTGDVAEFGPSAAEESRRWKPGNTAWPNVYSYSEWAKMEAAGAVFLPAAGYRYGASVSYVGSYGHYWSSSYDDSTWACNLHFYSGGVNLYGISYRCRGFSVRLVSEN